MFFVLANARTVARENGKGREGEGGVRRARARDGALRAQKNIRRSDEMKRNECEERRKKSKFI